MFKEWKGLMKLLDSLEMESQDCNNLVKNIQLIYIYLPIYTIRVEY